MLVVTRKRDQTVVIAGCIVVKVLSRKGSSIRLGIAAPPGIDVRRGEIKAHEGTNDNANRRER